MASVAATAARTLPDFSQLVEEQGPAVVFISVTRSADRAAAGGQQPDDEDLQEFFRRFGIPVPPQGRGFGAPAPQGPRQAMGVGSGFIVSNDGYILTNAHVVEGASEVEVKLADKREFRAKVVGADRRTDVAVVKIDATGLPMVKIGNPVQTRVGEWVAAIGAPFGLDNTVTSGIVSAKSRTLPSDTLVPFIQTDVAVNPGNSGGPLFNMTGEVIGINSQIYSRTGGYMGVSFAIPIDVAMQVKDQLVQHGKVTRGRIGVGVQPMNASLAESFGMKKAEGALHPVVERQGHRRGQQPPARGRRHQAGRQGDGRGVARRQARIAGRDGGRDAGRQGAGRARRRAAAGQARRLRAPARAGRSEAPRRRGRPRRQRKAGEVR